jgi:hypothetical protein
VQSNYVGQLNMKELCEKEESFKQVYISFPLSLSLSLCELSSLHNLFAEKIMVEFNYP